ncbi:MAG: hypothetical protein QNL04_15175 [SAR324 cluster bacterium]|nr:hypothetical protein [SAR324 cluster bacterium]
MKKTFILTLFISCLFLSGCPGHHHHEGMHHGMHDGAQSEGSNSREGEFAPQTE